MRHLDLFSGIGGFALATEMVWDDVEHIFCDNDPFSQAILKKHWPNSLIYGDIKELTANSIHEGLERQAKGIEGREEYLRHNGDDVRIGLEPGSRELGIDLLTGGFPCQPFSAAGRRRGTEDDRHLWPEMLRVIRETNPTYVLGENVGGFLTWNGGLVFEQVCADLEEAGYEVCPLVIPACAVSAPHRRDRVWIAAHAVGGDAGGTSRTIQGKEGTERLRERHNMAESRQSGEAQDVAYAIGAGTWSERRRASDKGRSAGEGGATGVRQENGEARTSGIVATGRDAWREDWPTVAARLCTLDDGLPNGLARPRGWRNAALKGAGNAIVPQVAAEILKAIKNL